MNLRSNNESEALIFGSAIHKALEHWYQLPESARELSKADWDIAQTMASPNFHSPVDSEEALASLYEFVQRAAPLAVLGDENKRSIANGLKILRAYFKHYLNDGLEILADSAGPMIERSVEFEIYRDAKIVINYFGTIDAIMRDKASGEIVVVDHKTTHALGTDFFNRINPNHQYTGYVWAAQRCLRLSTTTFLVNGIQVAKTKQEFARQATRRSTEDFAELQAATVEQVKRLLRAREAGHVSGFPMTAPGPCASYGGCQYLELCSTPKHMRDNAIRLSYRQGDERRQ